MLEVFKEFVIITKAELLLYFINANKIVSMIKKPFSGYGLISLVCTFEAMDVNIQA